MSRFIPVDPEKWAAMVIAQSDLVRYKEICDELDAECTRLKAEVERLTKAGDALAEAMWYGDNGRSIWVKKFAETDWNAAKEGKTK
jgi:hypothetical protein